MRKKALLVLVFIGLAGLIVGQAQAQDPIKELKEWAQQLEMRFQRTRLPPDP